ncbi:MAG: 3-phosphoserine/phosphohydroxythreonine transaminase [Xanthomonadales bacterium]|nr:3-phosphoserine/phosphohydroxythreonine transaminase [Xanthomonadales bacterium]ODU93893.1 MAG: phosphoserine transaminase [Rhodanobacter sp. SCN 66-43]OJY82600.1 MAG: phosphoserine transaminase [Xanthomonadales bacterium 66-474]
MSRAWNFSAGPAAMPEDVLKRAQQELLEWDGARASVMEVSHRGKAFMEMAARVEADLRELLGIPSNYKVLFLQGGATQHFAQVPMNIAADGQRADYIVNGHWGEKAASEAALYASAYVAATSKDDGYRSIPDRAGWDLDPEAAYVHITTNETIHGVEMHDIPDTGGVPLVADMSSDILSHPLDVSKFGLIYAGAQKNIGPSGLVVMIVREDLLQRHPRPLPRIFRYAEYAAADSMLNTPNTWGWYLAGLTFQWLKGQGGLAAMERRNRIKEESLYAAIDGSGGYYRNEVDPSARSRMNVVFNLHDAALEPVFVAEATEAGLLALKGHRALGGIRASIYNAVPIEGVRALCDFMAEFRRTHG